MKIKNKTNKSNFLKKIFIKLCRLLGFEIIDQSNFYLPISKKYGKENLSQIGKESLVIPMGRTKITRPIKSLDIILRTCASVNMLTQSKQRIFEKEKSEYSIKTLNSIIKLEKLNQYYNFKGLTLWTSSVLSKVKATPLSQHIMMMSLYYMYVTCTLTSALLLPMITVQVRKS